MNALAQLRGDPIMQEMAVELALIECGRYPNLVPSQVFRSVAPIIDSHTGRDGTIDPARLAATLEAELASIATTDVEVVVAVIQRAAGVLLDADDAAYVVNALDLLARLLAEQRDAHGNPTPSQPSPRLVATTAKLRRTVDSLTAPDHQPAAQADFQRCRIRRRRPARSRRKTRRRGPADR